ncbi:TonB-dependent receptor [Sphingomonas sp. dw_22]|uniref:TonB-dependent receptor domain-containing protein n=1 Tax=Sphingomonas sp. dw_22 TaxID=2721175 RepID=UPI001BD25C38|nr:TonB-dependent receptor [Sphingomonas sp. dw_22]
MHASLRLLAVSAIASTIAPTSPALAQTATFNVPSQDVTSAVRQLAQQARIQIVVTGRVAEGRRTKAISGAMSVEQALARMLANTGLVARMTGAGTYVIVGATGATMQDMSATSAADAPEAANADIVVTARKRTETLGAVPMAVTVMKPQSLSDTGNNTIRDYFRFVPGLNITPMPRGAEPGLTAVNIRGIATSSTTNPTVGLVIDDSPFGSSTTAGAGNSVFPNIDPGELERIEFLKGPQGTLYGSSGMGGLIKFVTKAPSTSAFSGNLSAQGVRSVNGDSGYMIRGGVNVPLSDNLAIRVGAFDGRDPGYIDNVVTGRKDVDSSRSFGGRAALLWQVDSGTTLRLDVMRQRTEGDGAGLVDANIQSDGTLTPAEGKYSQSGLEGNASYSLDVSHYALTLNTSVAGAALTSITTYNQYPYRTKTDLSGYAPYSNAALANFGTPGVYQETYRPLRRFSQEIRLSKTVAMFDILAGAYFTSEDAGSWYANLYATSLAKLSPAGNVRVALPAPNSDYREYAGFANVSAHLTGKLSVEGGIRYSSMTQAATTLAQTGPLAPANATTTSYRGTQSAVTFLADAKYQFNPDSLFYLRVASGFRPGVVNGPGLTFAIPIPYTTKPDRTVSYEAGYRGDFFDRKLTLDLSAYRIDWTSLQVTANAPLLLGGGAIGIYSANAGKAKSTGMEASATLRPTRHLDISGNFAVGEAKLTEALPAATAFAPAGTLLPYSSKFSASLTAEQRIDLGSAQGFIGGAYSYTGRRLGLFATNSTAVRQVFPSYSQLDLRAGVRYKSYEFSVFANNVTNSYTFLTSTIAQEYGSTPQQGTIVRPRTIGVNLNWHF